MRIARFLALSCLCALLAPQAVRAAVPPKVDIVGLKKEIGRHRGKVVLVNLWATWCGPCREEFPDLVRLHNSYRNKGLQVVLFSLDDVNDGKKVSDFLASHRATMPIFIKKPGGDEAFMKGIGKDWPGAVPYTLIYDRKGRLVTTMLGGQSYAKFEQAVKQALARS